MVKVINPLILPTCCSKRQIRTESDLRVIFDPTPFTSLNFFSARVTALSGFRTLTASSNPLRAFARALKLSNSTPNLNSKSNLREAKKGRKEGSPCIVSNGSKRSWIWMARTNNWWIALSQSSEKEHQSQSQTASQIQIEATQSVFHEAGVIVNRTTASNLETPSKTRS